MAKQKKLPAIQFYSGDWMKDPNLRSVSLSSKGLWIEMLCLMHESDRRGYLQNNGKPISHDQLARMTGCSSDEVSQCLEELENSGVFSRTKDGTIYSRRAVRDEEKRRKSVEYGKLGGNPMVKGRVNPPLNPKQTPSVSVSVSKKHTHKRASDPSFSTSSIDGMKSIFSPSYELCLSTWKEVSGKGVDQATRDGAKTLALAIDAGDLRSDDLAGIIRNGLRDVSDGKLPNQTLRGIARNWTRYVPEKKQEVVEVPKPDPVLYAVWVQKCPKCGVQHRTERRASEGAPPFEEGERCNFWAKTENTDVRDFCEGILPRHEKDGEVWK